MAWEPAVFERLVTQPCVIHSHHGFDPQEKEENDGGYALRTTGRLRRHCCRGRRPHASSNARSTAGSLLGTSRGRWAGERKATPGRFSLCVCGRSPLL